jgi:nitrite reductase/ring-hydroxylating ferredoxin subunit
VLDERAGAWASVNGLDVVPTGGLKVVDLDGQRLVVCRIGTALYAYRDGCPACRSELADATLQGEVLRCGGCGAAFHVRLAGRSLDGTAHHLDPRPLLQDEGGVRIAMTAGATW